VRAGNSGDPFAPPTNVDSFFNGVFDLDIVLKVVSLFHCLTLEVLKALLFYGPAPVEVIFNFFDQLLLGVFNRPLAPVGGSLRAWLNSRKSPE